MKLADQLAAAEQKLKDAEAFLLATKRQHAAAIAKAAELEELANTAVRDNHRDTETERKATARRLGVNTKAFRAAVRDWAGLKPGEEAQAQLRGADLLALVTESIGNELIERDSAMRALAAQAAVLSEQASRARSAKYSAEHPVREAHQPKHRAEREIREISDKLSKAAARAPKPASKKAAAPVSSADAARFVEVRKRLDRLRTVHHLDADMRYAGRARPLPARAWRGFEWTPPEES